jgi:hypothetical protein
MREEAKVWAVSHREPPKRVYLTAIAQDSYLYEPCQARALRFTKAEAERIASIGLPRYPWKPLVSDVGPAPGDGS